MPWQPKGQPCPGVLGAGPCAPGEGRGRSAPHGTAVGSSGREGDITASRVSPGEAKGLGGPVPLEAFPHPAQVPASPSERRREAGTRPAADARSREGRRWRKGVAGGLGPHPAASCRRLLWFRGGRNMEPAADSGERRGGSGPPPPRAPPADSCGFLSLLLADAEMLGALDPELAATMGFSGFGALRCGAGGCRAPG